MLISFTQNYVVWRIEFQQKSNEEQWFQLRDVIVITTAIMGDFKITLNAFIVL